MDRFIVFNVVIIKLSFLYLKSNMDRFIDIIKIPLFDNMIFKIQYGQIYRYLADFLRQLCSYLKSNMDRFIDRFLKIANLYFQSFKIQYGQIYSCHNVVELSAIFPYLKSNMDRFIDETAPLNSLNDLYLKSNMDRFIAQGYLSY